VLDEQGDGAPLLRGAIEAFTAIAAASRWERVRARRLDVGPWRTAWPALGADRTAYGLGGAATNGVPGPLAAGTSAAPRALSEHESLDLLRAAGLPVTAAHAAREADGAVEAARAFGGGTVAVKLDAADLPHKSDFGLVRLGVTGDGAVRAAATDLLAAATTHGLEARGLLVEPMADPGVELLVGLRRDPSFGPAVVVGLGGVLTEVLDDVSIRLAPVDREMALEMLTELRAARILDGVRGGPAVDRGAVADLIVALSRLGATRPDILEIDLNPVIASAAGALAVDALVVLEAGPEAPARD
jgi:acyl-CoA synthetase (NDP forming)